MDFGRSGNEFWHTWWPRGPEELNSPAFKAELFTDRGYIAYKGYYSMEEVMNGGQRSRMEMGGMM